jgi:predicted DNA-binding protein (MmcQ/YjbR family)
MRQRRGFWPTPPVGGLSEVAVAPMMPTLAKDMHQTVRMACLWLPEAEEFISHGSPNFRVRGKTFATYVVNHHGDQRVALWLPVGADARDHHMRLHPSSFFVPPYVGPRGWMGVRLDGELAWSRITTLIRDAYERVAPSVLTARIGKPPSIVRPKRLSVSDVDPMRSTRGRKVLELMREVCLQWPETREAEQFGHPVWKAGERSFAMARHDGERLTLCFWVGADRQNLLTADERFDIPPYIGHNGWIALDVSRHGDRREIENLARDSYRHFALKRMIRTMEMRTS